MKRLGLLIAVSLLAGSVGCAAAEEEEAESSLDAVSGTRPYRPQMADSSKWSWHTRHVKSADACTPSDAARATLDAATRTRHDRILSNELMLTTRNAAGPAFLSSEEMFPALAAVIANAEHEVDLQFAMNDHDSDPWHDVIGGLHRLYQRLSAEAAAGKTPARPVAVRVVVPNWFGDGNVQKIATAIRARIGAHDPALLTIEIAAHRQFALGIMHVKLAIIDGVIVHAGGGNLTHHQNYQDNAPHEQDSAYLVKGEVGKSALAQFDQLWNDEATSPHDCNAEQCVKVRARSPISHAPEVSSPDLARAGVSEDACLPMVFLARKSTRNPFAGNTDNPIGQGLLAAFRSSKSLLRVSTPNLNSKWAEAVRDILRGGATRVHLILPQTFNDAMEGVPFFGGGTNRKTVKWMTKQVGAENIGIGKTLDARWFSIDGRTIQRGGWASGGRHIKYYSVDGEVAIIGSANLDKQTMSRAREIAIVVDDPTVAKAWDAKIFDQDFARSISVDPNALPDVPDVTPDESMDDAPPDVQKEFAEGL